MLRFYKNFFRVFMNDIVIFSHILKKYLLHLNQIFKLFRIRHVNLTLTKFFLNYSLIILLNQQINNLDLFTSTKKIVVITLLRLLKTLKNFEYFLNFIK